MGESLGGLLKAMVFGILVGGGLGALTVALVSLYNVERDLREEEKRQKEALEMEGEGKEEDV
jgi:hypothetical protein